MTASTASVPTNSEKSCELPVPFVPTPGRNHILEDSAVSRAVPDVRRFQINDLLLFLAAHSASEGNHGSPVPSRSRWTSLPNASVRKPCIPIP